MKKKWIIVDLFTTLISLAIVFRFVSVDAPRSDAKAPPRNCLAANSPQSRPSAGANGEPVASCEDLDAIQAAYVKDIRPIFETKCLMCHGNVEKMPLYSKIPPFSWLIRSDIEEAKEHHDMSFDFPFTGKKYDVPQDGLEDLVDVVQENSMPPPIYLAAHWKSRLSREESQKILKWANDSLKALND